MRPRHLVHALAFTVLAASLPSSFVSGQGGAPTPQTCTPFDVLPDEPTAVDISGEGFTPDTRITIEGVGELIDAVVYNSRQISGFAPPLDPANPNQPPGLKTIVATRGQVTGFLQNGILYVGYGEPYLKSCWPSEISTEGGTLITFYGRNLREEFVPAFGGIPCESPSFVREDAITALSPPLQPTAPGQGYGGQMRDGPDGNVVAFRPNLLQVHEGVVMPVLTGVEPLSVDARGGGVITVRGENLRNDQQSRITFYTQQFFPIGYLGNRFIDPNGPLVDAIEGTTPVIDPADPTTPIGPYHVYYSDPRGDSWLLDAVLFTDHLNSVTPSTIASAGGTTVTFEGYGLEPDWIPRIGAVPCTDVVWEGAERMTALSPALDPGSYDVDMLGPEAVNVVAYLPGAITVVDGPVITLSAVDPAQVSSLGGTTVTFTGENFLEGLTPRLGGLDLLSPALLDPSQISGTTQEYTGLEGQALDAELVDAEGTVVASLAGAVIVVPPDTPDPELALGPTETDGTLAEGVARFEWNTPVEPVAIRVVDADGALLNRLPGNTRQLEIPVSALLDEYPLFLQSEFESGNVSSVIQIIAHRSGCAWPAPLTGIDRESDRELVLYGGNFFGEPGRCDAPSFHEPIPDLGGLNLLQLRQTSFRSQAGAGGGVETLQVTGTLISDYTRSRIETYAEDPNLRYVRRLATSLFTGFRLDRDADKLQIDATYAMPIFAFELKLKGRLIHVFPEDGFHDTFTFPEILPTSKTAEHGVTYFRADRDISDPEAHACGKQIPAGEYILELYAEGGEASTPYFTFETDGRNEEIVIPGVPCPPYPRVKVTNLTGVRSLPIVTKVTGVEIIPNSPSLLPVIQLTAHGSWLDENGIDEHQLSEEDSKSAGRKHVPPPFKFQWKVYDSQTSTVKEVTGSSVLVTRVRSIGCYSAELTVSDPDCPRRVQRDFEVTVFPAAFDCNSDYFSVLNPVPDPSTVKAVVGFASIPPGFCVPPRRKESFKVFVVGRDCCQAGGTCPAPQLGDVEFRLRSPDKILYEISKDRTVGVLNTITVEDKCQDQPQGPKYFQLTVNMDAINLVPGADAGRFVDVWLEARTVRFPGLNPNTLNDSWHQVGLPMRVTNRPAAMNTTHSQVSYSKSSGVYQAILQASSNALERFGKIDDTNRIPILSGIKEAAIPSFPSDISAGLTTAMQIAGEGGWKPQDAASAMAGELMGSALDGLPARSVGEALGKLEDLKWNWSSRQTILDTHFQQRLFQAIIFTGAIGPIPVTVWGSVSFALRLTITAAANVSVTPFAALLENSSYFKSQLDFCTKFEVSLPAELRTDVLFGIASLTLSFVVGANANFDATLTATNTRLDKFLRLAAQLEVKLAAKLCLFWFLCLPEIKIPLFEEELVNFSNPRGWEGGCGGGGSAHALNDGGSGGAASTSALRELLTVPASAVSPDGNQLFKLYYNKSQDRVTGTLSTLRPDGSTREEPIGITLAEINRDGPVDVAAAYVRSDRVLMAVGATYQEESSVPLPVPRDVLPPREQLNELKAQDEIVLCRLRVPTGIVDSSVFRLADPPAEVAPPDRRADGRPAIAGNARFEDAIVAWVRFESREFVLDEDTETTVYEPTGSTTGDRYAPRKVPTSLCNLRSTAIYTRAVNFDGALDAPRKISPAGINVQPTVAFSPQGEVAYCVWVNDPVNADLITSNRGRNLLYSIWTRATDSWSDPQPVLAQPDDFPGAMEPSIGLMAPGRGLLVFNALPRGAEEQDTGLNGSNRYAYLVRLQGGQFGAPVLVHGVCAQRVEARYVTIHVDPLQKPRLGPEDPSIRFSTPLGYLIGMQTGALGDVKSSGNILVAPVREDGLEATVATPILDDNRTHTNVVGALWNGGISTINLKGGLAQVSLGDGAGAGGGLDDSGYESIPLQLQPDLAVVSCKLGEQFPGPGARVRAAIEIENRGLVGSAMDVGGGSLCALRVVYTRVDGSETIEAEERLPVLLPGERTIVEARLEMPLDPVRLRVEITPNPGDRDPANDLHDCFFGAPEPQEFRCKVAESTHESRNLLVELTWKSPAAFDEILLWRDGAQIAAVSGDETTFVDHEATPGLHIYEIRSRIGVSRSCRVRHECSVAPVVNPSGLFRRGDVDGNGALEITDAIKILGFLFLGSAEPACADAADADDNGERQITDAIKILGYLFLGSPAPPAPGPDGCGEDPTEDLLPECGEECR